MNLIPLTHTAKVRKKAGVDQWGIFIKDTIETEYKARITYAIDTRVAGKTTGQPVTNIVPSGQIIFELAAAFSHDDTLIFTGKDGKIYEVKPDKIKPINDFNAKPIYWKVTF